MHTEKGWLHTLKLKLHNTLTQNTSFPCIYFTFRTLNETTMFKILSQSKTNLLVHLIIQQNQLTVVDLYMCLIS
jgi:hypothetical protein